MVFYGCFNVQISAFRMIYRGILHRIWEFEGKTNRL